MVRQITAVVLSGALAFGTTARPAPQRVAVVSKEYSKVEFNASSTFAKVVGVFRDWTVSIKLNSDTLEGCSLELQLDAASVHTGSGFKDREVKGKNFFNVAQYPEIKFVSTGVLADPDPHKFTMSGNLTLRGITRPVIVAVELSPGPGDTNLVNGTFTFNRREFGMTHDMLFNKIADIIRIDIALQLPSDAFSPAKP
jgi:polyisoprenoid-binding protein YceI